MKKIFDIFYSTRLTAVLFIVYSVAMGVATFIENDYGTQTAKALFTMPGGLKLLWCFL